MATLSAVASVDKTIFATQAITFILVLPPVVVVVAAAAVAVEVLLLLLLLVLLLGSNILHLSVRNIRRMLQCLPLCWTQGQNSEESSAFARNLDSQNQDCLGFCCRLDVLRCRCFKSSFPGCELYDCVLKSPLVTCSCTASAFVLHVEERY